MSIKNAKQLKENIEQLQHYYETFLDDGKCRAVKSRKSVSYTHLTLPTILLV